MRELSSANYSEFLKRFWDCHDAIIRIIKVDYVSKTITVILSVQDQDKDMGWVNLTFKIGDFCEFIFIESKSTNVIIYELKIGFFNDNIYLDFSPRFECPKDITDYRKSNFLIGGRTCQWVISEYDETGVLEI